MKKKNQKTIEQEFFENRWISPLMATPNNAEIVVIACDVDAGNGTTAQILQTCIYQLQEDGSEVWHCGQPFLTLKYWFRLPQVPTESLKHIKRDLIIQG